MDNGPGTTDNARRNLEVPSGPMMSVLHRTVLAPAATLLLPAYLSACFHYVPVDSGFTPPPGTNVRATLAEPMPFNMGTLTVNDVTSVEGLVVEAFQDSLGVWAKWLRPKVGARFDANSAQFYLSRGSIAQLEQWRVSGKRTVILGVASAGLVAGLLALANYALGKSGSELGDKDGGTILTHRR